MRLNDAEDLFEYASNPDLCRYVSWEQHKSIEDLIYTNTDLLLWLCSGNRR